MTVPVSIRRHPAARAVKAGARRTLARHLTAEGFMLASGHGEIEDALRGRMGAKRHRRYLRISDRVHAGERPIADLYGCVESLEEANLLMSHQADAMRASFAALERGAGRLPSGARVADLGTFTGALASFLALRHPRVAVTGIDRARRLTALAAERDRSIKNLRYERLDYAEPTPARHEYDVLLSSFGVDFPHDDLACGHATVELRQGPAYEEALGTAAPVLRAWRALAAPAALCLAVLRLPLPESVLAWVDAASVEGWAWRKCRSRRVRVAGEIFTLLGWVASDGSQPLVSEESVLAFVAGASLPKMHRRLKAAGLPEFADAEAVLALRALGPPREERQETRRFGDGHLMTKRQGGAKGLQFVLTRADTGLTHLVVGDEADRDHLDARFESDFWEGATRV